MSARTVLSDPDRVLAAERILFLGFVAPEAMLTSAFAMEPAPQVSAAKFQISFLSGLVRSGVAIEALSALPIASFPKSKIKFVRSRDFQMFESGLNGHLVGGANVPVLKLVSRLAKALVLAHRMAKHSSGDAILVYSLHTPFLLTALYLKRLTGLPAAVFIPDLPMHMHGRPPSGLHGLLKRLDNALLKKLVGGFDLAMPFTRGIGEDWLPPGMRFQVVDGIAPHSNQPTVKFKLQNPGRPKLLYTGSFTEIARFARLFSERPGLSAELIFAGDGADREQLEATSASDPRIHVTPFLSETELGRLIEQADFLLNPRDSRWEGGRYSFPSKLLDYAYRSKPILSTRLPGIDDSYFDYFLPIDDTDADSLQSSLQEAISLKEETLAQRVQATRQYFEQNNSAEAVAASVIRGIEHL